MAGKTIFEITFIFFLNMFWVGFIIEFLSRKWKINETYDKDKLWRSYFRRSAIICTPKLPNELDFFKQLCGTDQGENDAVSDTTDA